MTSPIRRIILTEGQLGPMTSKTAISVLRYCPETVAAVWDSQAAPARCGEVVQVGGDIPIVATLEEAPPANTLLIGIAPSGGKLPDAMRPMVLQAIRAGMTIESGLHAFLCDDPEFAAAARENGATLRDIRKNNERDVANRQGIRPECLRVHTVGHDCSIGKMVTSIEIARALQRAGHDAKFVATGQTGILIEGDGCPIDCVVSDFVNGAAEKLVLANQHHEILVIEGQGSLSHPRFSAVTLGLLHGTMPQALIFCYEASRTTVKGMEGIPIPPMDRLMRFYLDAANLMHPSEFLGIAINSRLLNDAQYAAEKERVQNEFQLPACDVIREGPQPLVAAVLNHPRIQTT